MTKEEKDTQDQNVEKCSSETKETSKMKEQEDIDKEEQELEENLSDSEKLVEANQQIVELEEELITEKEAKEKYLNRVQRLRADFDNYRKRVDKEKKQLSSQATKEFVVELLPIIDNFERALATSKDSEEVKDVLDGVEMIYRQLVNLLKKSGVEKIETVGEEFDPNLHEAVMKVDSDKYDSGIIVEELQKGYIYDDTIIRPAMVKVAE